MTGRDSQCSVQFSIKRICPPHEEIRECEVIFQDREHPDSDIKLSGTGTFLDGVLVEFTAGNEE